MRLDRSISNPPACVSLGTDVPWTLLGPFSDIRIRALASSVLWSRPRVGSDVSAALAYSA